LPGENPGIVPPPSEFSGSSLATMSFGQGVSVTPMAMARFYSAIANGGVLFRPQIIKAILDPNGRTIYQYRPQIERRVFSTRTARILQRYLRAVVARGTGNPAAQIPGYTTAGKTGTAAKPESHGGYPDSRHVASFVGFVPASRPRIVVLVTVDEPRGAIWGGTVAAPAFRQIAEPTLQHLEVPPDAR